MKVLIVKMSSMGDLIHTLPAVTDAKKAFPEIQFDWVAEEGFAEIPCWHPAVNKVIPVALRRWRKNFFSSMSNGELSKFVTDIKACDYDYVIDAQGLIKSALVTSLAKAERHGMDSASCKESFAAFFYRQHYPITKQAHAIERVRMLFAEVLGYTFEEKKLDYGLVASHFTEQKVTKPYLVFLHGSSADNKLWPIEQWEELAQIAISKQYTIYLPWGNEQERLRAEKIASSSDFCHALSKMNLTGLAGLLANASAVVGVDTGLAHLAAALSIPGITLYIDTYPKYTGACGEQQLCMSQMKIEQPVQTTTGLEVLNSDKMLAKEVWKQLENRMR
jgi:heptosyltransferase-1